MTKSEIILDKSELILITESLNGARDVYMREKYTLADAQKTQPKVDILLKLIERLNVEIRKMV